MRIFYGVLMLLFWFNLGAQKVVSEIEIEGAKKTKVAFLHKIIAIEKGSVLDSFLLKDKVQQLQRLPSISRAEYEIFPSSDDTYRIKFTVIENFTLIPYANIFTSSYEELALRIGLQEFNFLGRNITIGAFYQHDVFNSYGLNFEAPYLFGRQWGMAINYHDLTTQEPIFFEGTSADYKYNNHAIEVLGLYQINSRNRISLGGGFFTEDYDYIFGATSTDVALAFNVDKAMVKLIHDYDGIDYDYQYLNGFRNTFNFQYVNAIKGNLPSFVIGYNDLVYFRELWGKGIWANRLRLGLSTNEETPFAPFAVDNNINIRGVGNTIDRGTGTMVLNTEYRHNFIDKDWFVLQGNFFIDAGSWRNPGGGLDDFTNSDNIRVYPGIGLRFIHKHIFNAIFRIDYGYGITKDASRGVVFGIGQYF